MGGVLQYKLKVYCSVSLSSRLRGQQGPVLQVGGIAVHIGGVLQYFSDKLYGLGAPKQCPN